MEENNEEVKQEETKQEEKQEEECPFMETKTFCSQCKVHCYKKDKREQIRKVMRFSGPRMLVYHPVMAICHLYYQMKDSVGS